MNRYFITFFIFFAIAVFGVLIYLHSTSIPLPAPPQQENTTQQGNTTPTADTNPAPVSSASAVQPEAAVKAALQSRIPEGDQTMLYDTVISGTYALQVWKNADGGGEALLSYDATANKWTLVSWGGGQWSTDGLVEEGVPQSAASALLAGMPK